MMVYMHIRGELLLLNKEDRLSKSNPLIVLEDEYGKKYLCLKHNVVFIGWL